MKMIKIISFIFIIILAGLTTNQVSAVDEVPFEGLRLVYNLNLPLITLHPLSSFVGTAEFTFVNVTSKSSGINVVLNGDLTSGQETHKITLSQSAKSPVGKNTLLYLKPDCNPSVEKKIEIVGIPLKINGGQIYIEGAFQYEGILPVTTPAGSFTAYRIKNLNSVQDLTFETYLHYDVESKAMVYAEIKARSNVLTYSYTMNLNESNIESEEIPSSTCIIATAAYEGPLSPEVQELRDFRDNIVLKTKLGSAFMRAFNAWYYSFSPSIAEAERKSDHLRAFFRVVLYPLVGILKLSNHMYMILPFNPEINILLVGIGSSLLIGATYVSPIFVIIYSLNQRTRKEEKIAPIAVIISAVSVVWLVIRIPASSLGPITSAAVIFSQQIGAFGLSKIFLWLREKINR